MSKIVQEIRRLSTGTWLILALCFLLFFDMFGYYIAVISNNQIRPFYIMEQLAPFVKGIIVHTDTTQVINNDKKE